MSNRGDKEAEFFNGKRIYLLGLTKGKMVGKKQKNILTNMQDCISDQKITFTIRAEIIEKICMYALNPISFKSKS